MAAFKKGFLVLAVVLLALAGASGTAYAQFHPSAVITCTAFAVPATARAEGIAELLGDVIAQCNVPPSAGQPTQPTFIANIAVTLNVNVTNNRDFSPNSSSETTDAVMIVNEVHGVPTETSTLSSVANHPVPQYGRRVSPNRLEWNGAILPTPNVAPNPVTLQIRVSNMRGNVSQLGIPSGEGTFPSAQVTAFLQVSSQTAIPITNNVVNVGIPLLGLLTRFRGKNQDSAEPFPVIRLQCINFNIDGDNNITEEAGGSFTVRLSEGFASAFKTLGLPTTQPASAAVERGYPTPSSNCVGQGSGPAGPLSTDCGGATQGTRFIFRFTNVPSGVRIRMERTVTGSSAGGHTLTLQLLTGVDSNGAGVLNSTLHPSREVTISGGSGSAVYEVTDSNPFVVENVTVRITVGHRPDTANDLPAPGSFQTSVSFAPISTTTTSSGSAPEPRFVDTGKSTTSFTLIRCVTQLLYPFVTNRFGFDTGMSVANTTRDPFGTPALAGPCTINYFGDTTGGGAAPSPQTTNIVTSGQTVTWTLSGGNSAIGVAGAPGFQGYIIVVCQFALAHGFAFITDGFGGVPAIAEGYLALVLERPGPGGTVIFPENRGH